MEYSAILISAIPDEPQNTAKIGQPQKLPVIRYSTTKIMKYFLFMKKKSFYEKKLLHQNTLVWNENHILWYDAARHVMLSIIQQ